ncbi:MAG: polysaccharide deacetylase family protein [Flavobacteriaceae bacterium]
MLKKLLFKLLRFSGLPFLCRELIQRDKVTILLFHDIDSAAAKKSFLYLQKKYSIIALDTYLDAVKNGTPLPPKALIITFDDGHIKNYDLLPTIKTLKIPVTIFLCAAIINTNRHFWFKHKDLSIPRFQLKRKRNKEKLKLLAEEGFQQNKEFEKPQAMNKEQILAMAPYVNMQAHALYHPIFPNCTDQEVWKEIYDSKQILEAEYNFDINTIAYPNGDYSLRDIEMVKKAGYQCAVTVDYGFNTIASDPYRLKRLDVNDTNDLNELIVKASGLWGFFKTRNGTKQASGLKKTHKKLSMASVYTHIAFEGAELVNDIFISQGI